MDSNKVVDSKGTTRWYNEEGQLHREDDLPAVEWANEDRVWYVNGKLHREDDFLGSCTTCVIAMEGCPLLSSQTEAGNGGWTDSPTVTAACLSSSGRTGKNFGTKTVSTTAKVKEKANYFLTSNPITYILNKSLGILPSVGPYGT